MSKAIENAAIALAHAIMAEMQTKLDGVASQGSAPAPAPTPAPAADPFGGLGGGTPAPAPAPTEVTPKMIQELIMPMLSDDSKKAKLQAAMQSMGITELPAAKPEQLPELYAKFKAIADESEGTPAPSSGGGLII